MQSYICKQPTMENQRALRLVNRNLKTTREELLATILFGTQFDISSGNINEIRVRLEQGSATFFDGRAKTYNIQNFPDFKEPLKFFVIFLI